MFITLLRFDEFNPKAGQYYANREKIHGMLCKITGGKKRSEKNILYRVHVENDGIYLTVQYEEPLSCINENGVNYLCVDGAPERAFIYVATKETQIPQNGECIINISTTPEKQIRVNGKRVFRRIDNPYEQVRWITAKLLENGIRTKHVISIDPISVNFAHSYSKYHSTGSDFRLVVSIADAEKFKSAVENGIGPKKCYGMGMLYVG